MIRKDHHEKVYKRRDPLPDGKAGIKMVNLSGVIVTVPTDMRDKLISRGFQLAAVVEAEKKAEEKILLRHAKIPGTFEIFRKELPQFLDKGFSEVIPEPAEVK